MFHPEIPLFFRLVLVAHITAGFLALVVAPVALATVKGGKLHRRFGRAYVYAMYFVGASALVLAPVFQSWFLAGVAIFSSYMATSGWRVLSRKRPDRGQRARPIDWIVAFAACAAGVALVGAGIVARDYFGGFTIVVIVLGAISALLGARDIRSFLDPPKDRNAWLFAHLANMIGAYIATVTAFSATNFHFLHPIALRWLWPTVLGTIAIVYWTRRYKARFAKAREASSGGVMPIAANAASAVQAVGSP